VTALCVLPFLLVGLRVLWLQVARVEDLRRRADSQHMRRVWLPPHRGAITDRNGEPLAYTMFNTSIVAEPEKVTNPRETARALARALGTSPHRLERLLGSGRKEVFLERRVTPMLDRRVDLGAFPGIREEIELKRVYPQGDALAHAVGYVDHAGVGRGGIEKEFEWLLKGQPGWGTELRDALGGTYVAPGRRRRDPVPGHDIVLTLDATLQDVATSELTRAARALRAKGGALVAVDPATGEILALVSWPSFDPERLVGTPEDAFRNRAVMEPYEPGSTFKLVPAATALRERFVSPESPVHCENGSYNFGGYTIRDHHPHGLLTFSRAFAVSSNIAFAKTGIRCGPRMYQTARALGFGSVSGVELPGEAAGFVRQPERWSKRTAATLAIGYEVMATPLQLAMAYAAVANDGVLLRPHLVKAIVDPAGNIVHRAHPETVRQALSPELARTLRGLLGEVMTHGTGKDAALEWVVTGGKTGTTEKLVNGEYSGHRHFASFVGMAPLEHPRLVCAIVLDEPETATFGGSAAAPVFREMLEAAGRLPGAWLGPEYATVVVEPPPAEPRFWSPPVVLAGTRAAGKGADGAPDEVPDFRGLSLRQAVRTLRAHGIHAEVEGTGIVMEQEPAPGEAWADTVTLTLSRDAAGGAGKAALLEGTERGRERRVPAAVPARARRAARP
jgi:cell division protein FtsI (penicillin-binding protein 3)